LTNDDQLAAGAINDRVDMETNIPENPKNVPKNLSQQVETDKAKPITKTAQAILDALVNDPQISRESLAQLVGISEEAVKKQLQRLKERGIINACPLG